MHPWNHLFTNQCSGSELSHFNCMLHDTFIYSETEDNGMAFLGIHYYTCILVLRLGVTLRSRSCRLCRQYVAGVAAWAHESHYEWPGYRQVVYTTSQFLQCGKTMATLSRICDATISQRIELARPHSYVLFLIHS